MDNLPKFHLFDDAILAEIEPNCQDASATKGKVAKPKKVVKFRKKWLFRYRY